MNARYGLALLILIPTMLLLSAAVAVAMAWRYGRDTVVTELDAEQLRSCESLFRVRLPASAETVGFHMRVASQTTAHWRLILNSSDLPELVRASPFAESEWRVIQPFASSEPPYPDWWTPTAQPGTRSATASFDDQGYRVAVDIWAVEVEADAPAPPASVATPSPTSAPSRKTAVFLEWRRGDASR